MLSHSVFSKKDSTEILNNKLDDIRTLHQLLQSRAPVQLPVQHGLKSRSKTRSIYKASHKASLVEFKFLAELDGVIDRLEELYYKYYIKNNPTTTLASGIEEDIALSHKMKSMLPYAIALGMMADGGA